MMVQRALQNFHQLDARGTQTKAAAAEEASSKQQQQGSSCIRGLAVDEWANG